ncbi:NUDIX hydrolase domain-like protein [Trichoderma compactum]
MFKMSAQVPSVEITSAEPKVATQVPGDDVASTTEINKATDRAAPKQPAEIPVKVGVTSIIQNKEGKFLCSIRKGSHGAGTWQFPGGSMKLGEELLECAEREVLEETGLKVKAHGIVAYTNDCFKKENKHYLTPFAKCTMMDPDQEPQLMEPDKCEGWTWKSWEELVAINDAAAAGTATNALFLPLVNLIKETAGLSLDEFMAQKSF